jgi:integrase
VFAKKAWETCVLKLHFMTCGIGSRPADNGWPLHHVQRILGHADLKMTSTYQTRVSRNLQASI